METFLRVGFSAVLLLLATTILAPGQNGAGSICIAPIPNEPPSTAGTPKLACASGDFSVKIDSQKPIVWPKNKCAAVTGLDLARSHRIVVLCDGKPQQSFKFRLSDYKAGKACLWLNDLYLTAQILEPKQAPWCKCGQ